MINCCVCNDRTIIWLHNSVMNLSFFRRAEIERRLSSEALKAVFDHLHGQGQCEWLDGKGKNSSLVYWKTPTEWGNLIYNWAVSTGNTDTVCTVFELIEGDDTAGEYLRLFLTASSHLYNRVCQSVGPSDVSICWPNLFIDILFLFLLPTERLWVSEGGSVGW